MEVGYGAKNMEAPSAKSNRPLDNILNIATFVSSTTWRLSKLKLTEDRRADSTANAI